MEITLRKANAVQNSINEAIRSIKIETSIELNEFQDVTAELQAANNLLLSNDNRRQKLLLALYNIRGLVGISESERDQKRIHTNGARRQWCYRNSLRRNRTGFLHYGRLHENS